MITAAKDVWGENVKAECREIAAKLTAHYGREVSCIADYGPNCAWVNIRLPTPGHPRGNYVQVSIPVFEPNIFALAVSAFEEAGQHGLAAAD